MSVSIKWDKISRNFDYERMPINLASLMDRNDYLAVMTFINNLWRNGIPAQQKEWENQNPLVKRGQKVGILWLLSALMWSVIAFVGFVCMIPLPMGGFIYFLLQLMNRDGICLWCIGVTVGATVAGSFLMVVGIFGVVAVLMGGLLSGVQAVIGPGKLKAFRVKTTVDYFDNINDHHFEQMGVQWKFAWDIETRLVYTGRRATTRVYRYPRIDIFSQSIPTTVTRRVFNPAAQPPPPFATNQRFAPPAYSDQVPVDQGNY